MVVVPCMYKVLIMLQDKATQDNKLFLNLKLTNRSFRQIDNKWQTEIHPFTCPHLISKITKQNCVNVGIACCANGSWKSLI